MSDADRRPTEAQRRAIETTDRDVCVTAGAGCGKTFTLVERFLHLVVSGEATVAGILAITFTEKAAAEMKERVAARFEDEGLERERQDVERAAISTIHALCARLLRDHAIEAGVDPRFAVLTEPEADRLRREAMDEVGAAWRDARAGDLDRLRMLAASDLEDSLLDLHARIRSAGIEPGSVSLEPSSDRREALDGAVARSGRLARAVDAEGVSRSTKTWHRARDLTDALASAAAAEDPEVADAAIRRAWAAVKSRSVAKAVKGAFADARDAVAALREIRAEARAGPALASVLELVADLDRSFRRLKDDVGYLDFSDLELRALALLRERSDVAGSLRRRYPHLLVDETQDVSRIQADLVGLLRRPGGCFSVGDVKQSIYRFRHADVRVIQEEARRVGEEGRIALPETFRSRPEILAFVREVFTPQWPPGGDVVLEPMVAAGTFGPREDRPAAEVLLVPAGSMAEARRREADVIADRMVALVEGGGFSLGKGGEERPVRWGDVALLLRATRDVKVYERALLARDVPYHVLGGRGFWEAREIVDLANLLRVVAGPGEDEVALAATLRSPVVGLGDSALVRIFAPGEDGPRDPRRVLPELAGEESDRLLQHLAGEEADRLRRFLDTRDRLRALRGRVSLARMTDLALEETGLRERVLLQRNGRQRLANLRKVRALARDLDGKGLFSLSDFIDLVEERRDLTIREAEAPAGAEDEDVVKIMTIHGAKGLEFPVVFLADLTRGAPGGAPDFPWDPRLGLGAKVRDGEEWLPTRTARRLAEVDRKEEREESLRLLYVAMTRAAEHLVLSAGITPRTRPQGWLDVTLAGLGLSVDSVPPGESVAGPQEGRVRVVRSPETTESRGGLRPPLVRSHRGRLERGEPLAMAATPADVAFVDRLIEAAGRTLPASSHADYVVTVTEVLGWLRDPREAYLRYRIGRQETSPAEAAAPEGAGGGGGDETPGLSRSAAARGRAAHRFLEWFDPAVAGDEALAHAVRFLSEEIEGPGAGAAAPRLARAARRFHEGEVGAALAGSPAPGSVRREAPFLLRLPWGPGGGTLLRGTIDLVFAAVDGDWLVDYKTGRVPSADETPTGIDPHDQLRLYALALKEIRGRLPTRAVLWSLEKDEAVDVSLSPDHLDATWSRLEEAIEGLARGTVAMGGGDLASRCDNYPETGGTPACTRGDYR